MCKDAITAEEDDHTALDLKRSNPEMDQNITVHPAPWPCHAEAYWLVMYLKSGLDASNGIYAPLEASSPNFTSPNEAGKHIGGLSLVMIVRYSDTPCGPYDELMLIPGGFAVPDKKKKNLRISRIYVSQKETMHNGRVNWNIPKHLARFEFSSSVGSAEKQLDIKIYPPCLDAKEPFFVATLKPFKFLPAIPFNNAYIPSYFTTLVQPPLPDAGDSVLWDSKDEQVEAAYAPGTSEWAQFQVLIKTPRLRLCWVESHQSSDEKMQAFWPQTKDFKPWCMGLWMEDSNLEVSTPISWKTGE